MDEVADLCTFEWRGSEPDCRHICTGRRGHTIDHRCVCGAEAQRKVEG